MANYITTTDVQRRLRRTYDTVYRVDGALDDDVVAADIDAAEAEVDGYLSARYLVPITDASALRLVKQWVLTLLEERAYGAIPGRKIPESVSERVNVAREQLRAAASGAMHLGAAETPAERSDAADYIIVDGSTTAFGRDNMKGW